MGVKMVMTNDVEYRSRIDAWMFGLVWGICILLLGSCILVYYDKSTGFEVTGITMLTTVATVPFLLWSILGTRYRLTETQLQVRSGPFRTNIALDEITSIEPVRSVLSSPALSRDRFLIRYESFATVMISPADRRAFLQEVEARTPQLVWRDGKLEAVS